MDGFDQVGRRRTLKERLGLKGMGCCGATWSRPSTLSDTDEEDDDEGPLQSPLQQQIEVIDMGRTTPENSSDPGCVVHIPVMNLAAALAAERNFRAAQDSDARDGLSPSPLRPNNNRQPRPGTPLGLSLMRLLEESDGVDGERETETETETEKEEKGGGVGCDPLCCVCMGRKKGAAFIPCGHTFCRVCSRELWLNRGSCPLCNRPILEILDIF